MIPFRLDELARLLDAELVLPAGMDAATVVDGAVETDSRLVVPGSIFFALPGEVTDGHLFAPAAVEAGAALVIARERLDLDVAQLIVADGLEALGALAREVVARVRAGGRLHVVGITGSNGKTTTKNLLREILSAEGPTVAPRDSFNNQVGAPISMLRIDESTRYLVVEMGASGAGKIARLVSIARPDIGVVLKVGLAHAGGFGGIDATEEAKAEMVVDLPSTAVAILNADDHRVARMANRTPARVVTFGHSGDAEVRAEDVEATVTGTRFTLVADGVARPVQLRILGEHHVMNALAAFAVSRELGIDGDRVVAALERVQRAERWRMELFERPDGVTVVNDAYNASPDSVAAALKTLVQIARPEGRRTIAVLGEMAELGEYAQEEHDRIGRLAVRLDIRQLVVVGAAARHIHAAAGLEGSWDGESVLVDDADAAYDVLRDVLRPGDIVLVKSSNSAGLRHLGDRLAGIEGRPVIALLIAGAFSLIFTLFTTPLWIRLFNRLGWGQFIRDDGPQSHHTKRGTPTMGGIVFIVGSVLGYLVGHLVAETPLTGVAILVLGMMLGLGLVGFIDDFLKTRKQRSLGLGGWSKVAGQAIVATVFAILALNFPDENGLTPASTYVSFVRDIPWLDLFAFGPVIGVILFLVWVNVITISASNGVNVADGLDGLATGASIFAVSAYIFIGFWQFNQSCFNGNIDEDVLYKCYEVRDPIDLAVVAAAIAGSLVGFLWWNTSPAQLFMGDTGSLALGGSLAALAILSRTELLLILIGGLFLITTGSVIVQRAYFKYTKWRTGTGKRVFLMSPLHHHFELKGWAEITVVVRFWIIGALFVAAGVGFFYLEWVSR